MSITSQSYISYDRPRSYVCVNLRPAGWVGLVGVEHPLRFFADSKKMAARSATGFSPTLSLIFLATFVKVSILGH